ncbi:MAG: hypothetical protein WEB58_01755 [Planctomycetaceae bacterium]
MMKIYLDVSCLNRPFDDQLQTRIRLETTAINIIFERLDADWVHVASQMSLIEIDAMPDIHRKNRVRLLLPEPEDIIE